MKGSVYRSSLILILGALLSGLWISADAQQLGKVPRIGLLNPASPSIFTKRREAFRSGLRDHGYVEGKNIILEYRYAEGKPDRLPHLAAELVDLKVDVIVVDGGSSGRAAKNATQIIPIVMANVSDAVETGLIESLARPGGNITGLTVLGPELGGKRLELLKEIVPELSSVAVIGNPNTQSYIAQLKEIEIAARSMGAQVQTIEVKQLGDFENAATKIAKGRAGGLIALADPTNYGLRERITELAAKAHLPAVYTSDFADAGGLMSYGANTQNLYYRATAYVDRILKGARPADLPVERPTKFELVINLKTAKQIDLKIPPNVLARADRIIR